MESLLPIPPQICSFIEEFNISQKQRDLVSKELAPLRKTDAQNQKIPELENQSKALNDKLGQYTNDFVSQVRTFLEGYLNGDSIGIIEFPSNLDGKWRKIVHDECDILGLGHESKGTKKDRKLVISRKDQPVKKQKNSEFEDCPDAIMKVTFANLNSDQITIQFAKPDENGSSVQSYNLYVYDEEEFDFKKTMTSKENKFTVKDLKPSTLYAFQITAENKHGESDKKTTFKFMTPLRLKGSAYVFGSDAHEVIHSTMFNYTPAPESEKATFVDGFIPQIDKIAGKCADITADKTALALLNDGKVLQWGLTLAEASLQMSGNQQKTTIVPIISEPFYVFSDENVSHDTLIKSVHLGADFAVATDIQGRVFTWGLNENAQLGLGDQNPRLSPTLMPFYNDKGNPVPVFITQVAVGSRNAIALSEYGKVYVWGKRQANYGREERDRFGQVISYENLGFDQIKPRHVNEVLSYYKVKKVAAGDCFNLAITETGQLYSWGSNESGQLGIGITDDKIIQSSTVPRKVEYLTKDYEVIDADCGQDHCLVLVKSKRSEKKAVFAWGNSKVGQCGHNEANFKPEPKQIEFFNEKNVVEVKTGWNYSLVLCEEESKEKELYGFGKVCSNKKLVFGKPQKFGFGKIDSKSIQSVKAERRNIFLLVD